MTIIRRRFLQLAVAAAALPAVSRVARAETYPARPVHIVVPVPPGGALDITARLIGNWMSQHMGQSFIIDNRPGGGTNIGVEVVAHAAPDGYTLLLMPQSVTINPGLYKSLPFDFIRDIIPVSMIVQFPLVMEVSTAVPAKTVAEFIAYAKAKPGKVNMASGGVGSPSHVVGELFQQTTGITMVHVPYHGGAPALAAMMANQVQVMFSPLPESIASIKAGKVRALAVTSVKRAPELPDAAAVAETVPGFEAVSWNGIGAPKKTPADIVAKLNKEINMALADPAIKARLTQLGG
ncbi:MAG TPA: tripartite tricarboxylate transporter substrate-binding protein, partial [Pseudolabrys sp.]|nr:tripartite tricarboxylate transporter substrate-binding protein [Pseudolabrys sp.]